MFLSYADESGFNGKKFNYRQPVQVMVSIFPNVYNFHKSDSEFKDIFRIINKQIPISEIKGEQIYRGRGSWNSIKTSKRDDVIEFYLDWIKKRNHRLIVTAIDNKTFFDFKGKNPENTFIKNIPYPYLLAGLHIALVVQKLNYSQSNNKGKTLLVFDEQDQFVNQLTELTYNPPHFIDDFIAFNAKQDKMRLNQIIDSAFFVKSHHSSMAQVVDIVAYLYRVKLELEYYDFCERYKGEKEKIKQWLKGIDSKIIPFSKVYPKAKKPFVEFINLMKANGI